MGWLFGWRTRRELINHLVKELNNEHHKLHKHCFVGNTMWGVIEDLRSNQKVVLCILMAGRNHSRHGWGYKDMDETMGPCETSCPVSYLELATPPPKGEYVQPWREKVRRHHRKLVVGQRYTLLNCKIPDITISKVRPLRGTGQDGVTYRIHRSSLGELLESAEHQGRPASNHS